MKHQTMECQFSRSSILCSRLVAFHLSPVVSTIPSIYFLHGQFFALFSFILPVRHIYSIYHSPDISGEVYLLLPNCPRNLSVRLCLFIVCVHLHFSPLLFLQVIRSILLHNHISIASSQTSSSLRCVYASHPNIKC